MKRGVARTGLGPELAEAFPAGRWRARWIGFERPRSAGAAAAAEARGGPRPTPARTGALRRRFRLERVPESVPARLTADSRYVLWVNGHEACRGPIRDHPSRLHADLVDLAPWLRSGENTLAVLLRFYGRANGWWMPAHPEGELGAGAALVFEARLGESAWLVSDARWKALPLEGWRWLPPRGIGGVGTECVDALALPAAWWEPDFDDAGWETAVEVDTRRLGYPGHPHPPSPPYGALPPRPIAPLGCERRVAHWRKLARAPESERPDDPVDRVLRDRSRARPLGVRAPAPETWLELELRAGEVLLVEADFREVVCGTVVLELEGAAGIEIDLAASELPEDAPRRPGEDHRLGLRYRTRGGRERFESFDPLGFRHATLAVRGRGQLRLAPLAVNERLYPRAPGPSFACSDERLTRIWDAGRRTVDLCAHDAYVDCPTREQRAWTGDGVVHLMVDLASRSDWRLAERYVELAACPRPDGMLPMAAACDFAQPGAPFIPDWALHWIHALHQLHRYTGDRERLARLLPVAEGVLRWFESYRGEDGLLADVAGWVLIDWSAVSVRGRSACLNALWGRALREFAELARTLGDRGRAAWARRLYADLRHGFELFWDRRRRRYADHFVEGRLEPAASEHTQAAAVCAGLVPRRRRARLAELLGDRSRFVHAAWSAPSGDPREARPPQGGIGGAYLLLGPPPAWWDVEQQLVAAQPFFRYVVHDALAELGHPERIPALCLDWLALLERASTLSETWYGGTTCHGWSATPTRDLVVWTLGVRPAEPGFARARVAPRLGPLEWARGAVPAPAGLLAVEATRERVKIESPIGLVVDLGDGATRELPPGEHTIEIARRA